MNERRFLPELPFLRELKRRNVVRVALLYLAVCWLILEPIHVVFHMLEMPPWINRLVILLMGLGFPVALIFSWVYEITPEGLKPTGEVPHGQSIRKQTARRLDFAIIAVLALAVAYLLADKLWLSKHTAAAEHDYTAESESPHIPDKSIAILPFTDLSEKRDQQYFADGMAEEILNLLAGIPELKVIGRTSSFSFKGKDTDVRLIGRSLGAAYVLEGSVRRSADQIRVTTQLLDARDGSHRWSETFNGDTTNIFQLQDEIAGRIAHALSLTISTWSLPRRSAVNPDAYDYYVRGNRDLEELSEESVDQALALFDKALSIDPKFTEAAVGIATAHQFTCVMAWKDHRHVCEMAKQAVDHAIKLNPRSADAYAIRAELHTVYDWDWSGAESDVRRAEEVGGGETTQFAAARVAYALGEMDSARRFLDEILSKNPLNANAMSDRGYFVEYRTGRFNEAERWLRRANQITPDTGYAHYTLGVVLLVHGKYDEALQEMKLESDNQTRAMGLALAYHALGRPEESDAALREAVKLSGPNDNSMLARVYAFRGDRDHALQLLSVAYDNRDSELWYVKGDQLFSNLESDPRYQAFLRKMNLFGAVVRP